MKTQTFAKLATIGFTSLIIAMGAPLATAASFTINGGFVTLGIDKVIRLSQASGRSVDLGKNYYRTATIGCTSIKNTMSKGSSGPLSF